MKKLPAVSLFSALMIFIGAHGLWAQNLTITNVRIIVGNGQVIERGSIVVRNGRILSIAEGASSAPPAPTIDAHGMTAMPGFIDAHRHIIAGNADQWLKEQAPARMQEFLDAGYTSSASASLRWF